MFIFYQQTNVPYFDRNLLFFNKIEIRKETKLLLHSKKKSEYF